MFITVFSFGFGYIKKMNYKVIGYAQIDTTYNSFPQIWKDDIKTDILLIGFRMYNLIMWELKPVLEELPI